MKKRLLYLFLIFNIYTYAKYRIRKINPEKAFAGYMSNFDKSSDEDIGGMKLTRTDHGRANVIC